jgi:hypothetical protein
MSLANALDFMRSAVLDALHSADQNATASSGRQ